LLYCPSDTQLSSAIVQGEADSRLAYERLRQLKAIDGLIDVEEHLRKLLDERLELKRKLREEIREQKRKLHEANLFRRWQRKNLLQRNWKAMRGYEWEEYLVEVCRALGASRVDRIGGAGDQGVDLIVEFGAKRIAVQAKGYENPVGNTAVQEAYAGMTHHRCTACAVITNSWFRKSAIEIADSTFCILIGENEFPDFVMGKLELKTLADAVADRGKKR
jgi:restriction endonuclease Mrr